MASTNIVWCRLRRAWLDVYQIRRAIRGGRLLPSRQVASVAGSWSSTCKWRVLLTLPFIPTTHAFWGKKEEKAEAAEAAKTGNEKLIEQADQLYKQNDILALYELLSAQSDSSDPEILWRLARAATDKGKILGKDPEKKALIYEAFELIKKALTVTDMNSAVHKWYAILLDYVGEYEGTKQRITNAFIVKEHLQKAIKLDPKDATSVYSLGYWCFLFADMGWVQRKVAAVIFASPPTSTYEEALQYFLQAEQVDPGFYSTNLLMIGKTYIALNKKDEAVEYLKRARAYPVKTEDDKQAHKESISILQAQGVKD